MSTKLTADPEAKAERRRKVLVGAGALTAIAVVGGLVTLAVIQNPPPQAREDIEIAGLQTFEGLSANHVSTPVDYEQSPPVGGAHDGEWADCTGSVYGVDIRHENAVHSLKGRRHVKDIRNIGLAAGFTIDGTPAMNAGASFSRNPHTGKLYALICTATPGRRV